MPLFGPPNIDRLTDRHDIRGLIKALNDRDDSIERAAAAAQSAPAADARRM